VANSLFSRGGGGVLVRRRRERMVSMKSLRLESSSSWQAFLRDSVVLCFLRIRLTSFLLTPGTFAKKMARVFRFCRALATSTADDSPRVKGINWSSKVRTAPQVGVCSVGIMVRWTNLRWGFLVCGGDSWHCFRRGRCRYQGRKACAHSAGGKQESLEGGEEGYALLPVVARWSREGWALPRPLRPLPQWGE